MTGRRADVGDALAAELASSAARRRFRARRRRRRRAGAGAVAAAVERLGRIDGLVNAAGLTTRGTLLDTTPELFDAARRGQPAGRRSS